MREPTQTPGGHTNIALGWTGVVVGLLIGLVVGLWAFDGPAPAPEHLADYGSTQRRLLRLSHIAWIALGLINVLLGTTALAEPARVPQWTRTCMNVGAVFLPLTLLVAVWLPPAKYLMALPACCVLAATAAMAASAWRRSDARPREER